MILVNLMKIAQLWFQDKNCTKEIFLFQREGRPITSCIIMPQTKKFKLFIFLVCQSIFFKNRTPITKTWSAFSS